MLDDVRFGLVSTVITKDLSRFGRNHIEMGIYTDILFSEMDVRFIAIHDGVDTFYGESDFAPLRNIMNEWVSRDTSNKVRAVIKARAAAGERLCNCPPYGYKVNPKDSKQWRIDENAAIIVRRIFQWCMTGLGPAQIARRLREEKVYTPTVYFHKQGRKTTNQLPRDYYCWSGSTVARILERQEYLGHTVNFKTYRKSYKDAKTRLNPPEEWLVLENTHDPIIEKEIFEIVQRLRQTKRRPTRMGDIPLFSGLMECADCGRKMYFCRSISLTKNQECYVCSGSRKTPQLCSTHYIREVTLEQRVLDNLNYVLGLVKADRVGFMESILNSSLEKRKQEVIFQKSELSQLEGRVVELDSIIKQVYEDGVFGRLPSERFQTLLAAYEMEQSVLKGRVGIVSAKLNQDETEVINVERFLEALAKFEADPTLKPDVVRELVFKIAVHAPDKRTGKRAQALDIYYNFGINCLKQ